jgi:hypothetical protein
MKKILIGIFIVLFAAGGYLLWTKRYEWFFKGDLPELKNDQPAAGEQVAPTDENQPAGAMPDETLVPAERKNTITDYDCSQGCQNRQNTESYDYCRELCGYNDPVNGTNSENDSAKEAECENLNGYERDVCYKKRAILKKNDSDCRKITDKQLQENCFNRVAEEILE